jgi:hypothetical protein
LGVAKVNGCWRGLGHVGMKAVAVALRSKPILDDAMVTIDVVSNAVADPNDRYSAHLVFGGAAPRAGEHGADIVSFWSDSFGGDYTALGRGQSRPDGFDVSYEYPADTYINRWTLAGENLTWKIVARDSKGQERPFADYALSRTPCPAAEP